MAYATAISCNRSLREGMTDGAWKKYGMNRGGVVEGETAAFRQHMSGAWHGFHPSSRMCLPDASGDYTSMYYHDLTPEDDENI